MTTTTKTVEELLKTNDSPLPLDVFPNKMGINLVSVEALTWTRRDDGQLVNLMVHFIPAEPNNCEHGIKGGAQNGCSECAND